VRLNLRIGFVTGPIVEVVVVVAPVLVVGVIPGIGGGVVLLNPHCT